MSKSIWSPDTFESLFDEFVLSQAGGRKIDSSIEANAPEQPKCVDYIFEQQKVIVELKTLEKSHGDVSYVLKCVKDGLAKFGFPASRLDDWMRKGRPLPNKVARFVDNRVQNSLKKAVRKANDQITSTRSNLGYDCDSVLVVANLNETLFRPIELLRYLAGHALARTKPAIDAVLLLTPGVLYCSGNEHPKHYAAPTYAEDKQYLGNFLEPLIERWLEFEAQSMGLELEIEKQYEISESDRRARPVS